jgi:hypothetical protein
MHSHQALCADITKELIFLERQGPQIQIEAVARILVAVFLIGQPR